MAFIGLLAYITVVYMRPQEWVGGLSGVPLATLTAAATIAAALLQSRKKPVSAPQNGCMLGFLAALVASLVSNLFFGNALAAVEEFMKIVIMFFLIVNIVDSLEKFTATVALIVVLTLVMALQGIEQYNTGYGPLAGQPLLEEQGIGRITWIGIFNDPNDLAMAFIVALPFLIYWLFEAPVTGRVFSAAGIGVLLYGLYLTNSRGGIMALGVVGAVYPVLYFMRKRFLLYGIVIGLLLVAALARWGPSRISNMTPEDESAYGRIEAWYEGVQMLKNAPLFGVGYGMFTEYHYRTAHNSLILCAAETGIVGLFFWVGLFYFSFRGLAALQRRKETTVLARQLKGYALALMMSLLGFLTAAFFLSRTYVLLPFILVALSVSLFAMVHHGSRDPETQWRMTDVGNIIGFSTGGILLAYGIIRASI